MVVIVVILYGIWFVVVVGVDVFMFVVLFYLFGVVVFVWVKCE